jgi:hypothetical protein
LKSAIQLTLKQDQLSKSCPLFKSREWAVEQEQQLRTLRNTDNACTTNIDVLKKYTALNIRVDAKTDVYNGNWQLCGVVCYVWPVTTVCWQVMWCVMCAGYSTTSTARIGPIGCANTHAAHKTSFCQSRRRRRRRCLLSTQKKRFEADKVVAV